MEAKAKNIGVVKAKEVRRERRSQKVREERKQQSQRKKSRNWSSERN